MPLLGNLQGVDGDTNIHDKMRVAAFPGTNLEAPPVELLAAATHEREDLE